MLNGRKVESVPAEIHCPPGSYQLTITARGFLTHRATVVVQPDMVTTVDVRLQRSEIVRASAEVREVVRGRPAILRPTSLAVLGLGMLAAGLVLWKALPEGSVST